MKPKRIILVRHGASQANIDVEGVSAMILA